MKRCLVYLDAAEIRDSVDLLEAARRIHGEEAYETVGAALHRDIDPAMGAFDRVIQVTRPDIKLYDPAAVTGVMLELQQANGFDSILVPATPFGRMLAPRLAMGLGTGLVADVTAIRKEGDALEIIRPAFSGRLLAGIRFIGDGPIMMSIRQGVFQYGGSRDKKTLLDRYVPAHVRDGKIRRLAVKEKEQIYDIRKSDVLVSGGGGVKKNFHQLERLAEKLGGHVSASRKIVDSGIAPRSIQVGQSGKTVSPRLYMALGIYGAVQHVEGLKRVEHIIAVNVNKNAPICSLADIVVEGDAGTFVEKLADKIEAQGGHQNEH